MIHTNTLDAALELVTYGFPVFPLQPRSKDPYAKKEGEERGGFYDATTDVAQIRAWWSEKPESNLAVRPPPDVLVVDVDAPKGGNETLARLQAEHGSFPDTLRVLTGSNGQHMYFRVPPGLSWPRRLGTGIDLKGHKAYLVAPPSIHPDTGQAYRWHTPLGTAIAPAPAWVVSQGYVPTAEPSITFDDEGELRNADEIAQAVRVLEPHFTLGKRHDLAFALGGWLRKRGWNRADVKRVISQLPTTKPRERAKDASDGYQANQGWQALTNLVGPDAAKALDKAISNPRYEHERAEHDASVAAMLEGMRASAVELPARGPALLAPPPMAMSLAAAGATPATPANVNADPWSAVGVRIDLSADPPPMPWLIKDLEIGPGRPTGILAYANGAKTPVALALAVAIASGKPVLEMPVKQGRVAWLAFEATRVTHGKARRIAMGLGADLANLDMVRMTRLLTEPGVVAQIATVTRAGGYAMIVIDTYTSAIAGIDHNSAEFADALRQLERLSDETGAAVVVLVHAKKDHTGELYDLSGHNTAAGALQVVIGLSRPEPEDKFLIQVSSVRELDKPFAPFQVRFVDDEATNALRLVRVKDQKSAPVDKIQVTGERILDWLRAHEPEGKQVRQDVLFTEVALRVSDQRAALRRLAEQRKIELSGSSPIMVSLRLAPPDPGAYAPPVTFGAGVSRPAGTP